MGMFGNDWERRERQRVLRNLAKTGDTSPRWRTAAEQHKVYGQLPARYAHVSWDTESQELRLAKNVTVAYYDRDRAGELDSDWDAWFTFSCDQGNSVMGWPHEPFTPEVLFGTILGLYGFGDEQELFRALHEFGRIESCRWARDMLQGACERIRDLARSDELIQPGLLDWLADQPEA